MRTVFCEYTLYFFCAFFCVFLLFLLLLSPFFGILAGRQRAPEVAGRMHAGAEVLVLPSPRALRFRLPWSLLDLGSAGWRMFCACRRRAAKRRVSCPRAGCGTGDAACLDLDLQLRDAPAPAAPRWRKTHWGLGSAPVTVQSLCLTREKWRRKARCPCRKTGFAGRIIALVPPRGAAPRAPSINEPRMRRLLAVITAAVPRTVNGTGHTGPSEFCATSI